MFDDDCRLRLIFIALRIAFTPPLSAGKQNIQYRREFPHVLPRPSVAALLSPRFVVSPTAACHLLFSKPTISHLIYFAAGELLTLAAAYEPDFAFASASKPTAGLRASRARVTVMRRNFGQSRI